MKTRSAVSPILVVALCASLFAPVLRGRASENVNDSIETVRTLIRADRRATLKEAMQFTAGEAAKFWPLYDAYRADMDQLGDQLVKLILEYGDHYPNVPEERARQLLKDYLGLEEKILKKRTWYLKRAHKSLPAAKVLLWAQVENRLDLALRLQLAGTIPLVPVLESKP